MGYVMANTGVSGDDIGTKLDFAELTTNGPSVRAGKVALIRSNIDDPDVAGFTLLEARLQGEALEAAKEITSILCDRAQWSKNDYYLPQFTVVCPATDETVHSNFDVLPKKAAWRYDDLSNILKAYCVRNGIAVEKLTISVLSVEKSTDGKFNVRLRLFNSGRDKTTVDAPDSAGPRGYLSVGIPGENVWAINNASSGKELSRVTIDPGQFFDLSYSGVPYNKIPAGTYDVSAWITLGLSFDGPYAMNDDVSFHSDFRAPLRITFDRDYPSTPQEREQWEAMHKAEMSRQPVKPGQTFAEDGLYRAVRTDNGHRGLLLKPFKAGEAATTGRVTMPMEQLPDVNIDGPVQWVWEATAPTPVKQWSFDMIADTVQFCESGAECPRSGRWVRRIHSDSLYGRAPTRYDLASIVTRRRGERMPEGDVDSGRTDWEWVGA